MYTQANFFHALQGQPKRINGFEAVVLARRNKNNKDST